MADIKDGDFTQGKKLVPAESISSTTEGVEGLFLRNIVFLCQILHTDLQLLRLCSALPFGWKLPGMVERPAAGSSHYNQ